LKIELACLVLQNGSKLRDRLEGMGMVLKWDRERGEGDRDRSDYGQVSFGLDENVSASG
jgi:hypothetical protein